MSGKKTTEARKREKIKKILEATEKGEEYKGFKLLYTTDKKKKHLIFIRMEKV